MSMTAWGTKAGVELTFQPPFKKLSELNEWDDYSPERNRTIGRLEQALPDSLYWACTDDPDCIEIPTRPLKSWEDAKSVITQIIAAAKAEKLVAKCKVSTGGGGHVHVGLPKGMKGEKIVAAAIRDMQNRPYVTWMFADPDTTTQAANQWEHVVAAKSALENPHWCDGFYNQHWGMSWKDLCERLKTCHGTFSNRNKRCPVSSRPIPTMEFRFFDCFMEWERYEESLAFAQAYTAWIKNRIKAEDDFPVLVKNHRNLMQYNDYYRCIEEFKQLIEQLGLPWERYKRYVKNLNERFSDARLLT